MPKNDIGDLDIFVIMTKFNHMVMSLVMFTITRLMHMI